MTCSSPLTPVIGNCKEMFPAGWSEPGSPKRGATKKVLAVHAAQSVGQRRESCRPLCPQRRTGVFNHTVASWWHQHHNGPLSRERHLRRERLAPLQVTVNAEPSTTTVSVLAVDSTGKPSFFTTGSYASFVYPRADVVGKSGSGTVQADFVMALSVDPVTVQVPGSAPSRRTQERRLGNTWLRSPRAAGQSCTRPDSRCKCSESGPAYILVFLIGSLTRKQVYPGRDTTLTFPRCLRTMRYTVSRPSPVPSPMGLVVKKGSKILV